MHAHASPFPLQVCTCPASDAIVAHSRGMPWATGSEIRDYTAHRKKVHTVAWSGNGSKLASGSVDQSVRVWTVDETTGRATDTELKGHTDTVDQLRWDPTHPEVLGTISADKTVRIWDARTAKCAHAIETRGENINMRWRPDGQHIAVGDKEDHISFIEMRKMKTIKTHKFAFEVNEMSVMRARAALRPPRPRWPRATPPIAPLPLMPPLPDTAPLPSRRARACSGSARAPSSS